MNADSKFFWTCALDERAKKWNLQSGKLEQEMIAHSKGVSSCVISPNGKYLITGGNDQKMKLWNEYGGEIWQASGKFIDGKVILYTLWF